MTETPFTTPLRPELVFTRRFSMGHRLISGASERCAIPHGHNEHVTVTLGPSNAQGARLDGHANMMVPFAEAKGRWHHFIDERMDHGFQLNEADPLLQWFATHEPRQLDRIIVTPGDPTTELLAALLMAKLNAILVAQGNRLTLHALEIRETPTNAVRLVGNDPTPYLPPVQRSPEECWWHRADSTTRD